MKDELPPTSQTRPEEPLATAEELFPPIAQFNKFKKYWKTREAIMGGTAVYDMSKADREEAGYFGPWAFNGAQSAASAIPAAVAAVVIWFFRIEVPVEDTLSKLSRVLLACSLPFIMMLIAYTVGRASLWKGDSTKSSRIRAARIYLYLDGAYGLYPQLLWSVVSIPQLLPAIAWSGSPVNLIGTWQFIVSMKTIPNDLFPALGYWGGRHNILVHGTKLPSLMISTPLDENAKKVSQPEPPVWKYRLSVLLIAPLIAVGCAVAVVVVSFILTLVIELIRPHA
jgi:hypothetical protein